MTVQTSWVQMYIHKLTKSHAADVLRRWYLRNCYSFIALKVIHRLCHQYFINRINLTWYDVANIPFVWGPHFTFTVSTLDTLDTLRAGFSESRQHDITSNRYFRLLSSSHTPYNTCSFVLLCLCSSVGIVCQPCLSVGCLVRALTTLWETEMFLSMCINKFACSKH